MRLFHHHSTRFLRGFTLATLGIDIMASIVSTLPVLAEPAPQKIGAIFYIELENQNWTQPPEDAAAPPQIFGNPAAPYLNSLVAPNNPNSEQVSYATAFHQVLSKPNGANPSIHPSEANYIWQEAGTNFGIHNDNDPYATSNGSVPAIKAYLTANPSVSGQHLTGLLQARGISWKSYQEDTNLLNTDGGNFNQGGTVTNVPITDPAQLTVPLSSFNGTAAAPATGVTYQRYTNAYNGSHQYNFACKHDGTLFFEDTNGGNDRTTANKEAAHHLPLQQLQADLDSNTVARYNLVTPDQYNDMHSALNGGFTYHDATYTGALSKIAAGDNFLSIIIPKIMASKAYKDNGLIVIWTDETEGANRDDFSHTLTEIIISPSAKGNAYASAKAYTHSSDLNTLQKIYQIRAATPTGYLNDAANPSPDGTTDLSDLFKPGVIPEAIPDAM
jgi:hypothetical protein